jgi:hypothetical protein
MSAILWIGIVTFCTSTTSALPLSDFFWLVFSVQYVQEYRPYLYDISRLPECAYANRHFYNITFCMQDNYFPVTWLVFFDCLGLASLSVRHQSAARVRLRQQALLQHNLLPTGWLLSSDLSFLCLCRKYCPYQYDISRLPECTYANRHYYNITFCLQDDYFPAVLWNRNDFLRFRFRFILLKSYGSGSGSGSYFWKVTVPVPVPVLAPYLDHKKLIFQEKVWIFFCLFT